MMLAKMFKRFEVRTSMLIFLLHQVTSGTMVLNVAHEGAVTNLQKYTATSTLTTHKWNILTWLIQYVTLLNQRSNKFHCHSPRDTEIMWSNSWPRFNKVAFWCSRIEWLISGHIVPQVNVFEELKKLLASLWSRGSKGHSFWIWQQVDDKVIIDFYVVVQIWSYGASRLSIPEYNTV